MTTARPFAVIAGALAAAAVPASAADRSAADAGIVESPCEVPAGFAPPFSHVYHLRDGRTLVFVAVDHSCDPDDASHRLIARTVERFKPALILIEGIGAGSPTEIAFQQAAADRQWRSGAIQETLYTVKLASERGIAFASWDYRPGERMRLAVAQGFALFDVLGATLLHDGVDPGGPSSSNAEHRDMAYASGIGPIAGFDYPAWFRQHHTASARPIDSTPCGTGITSQILRAESDARSAHLADLVMHPRIPANTLMVEAGANHWLALRHYLASQSTMVD